VFSGFSLVSYEDGEYGASNNLFGRLGYYFSYLLFYFFGRSAFFTSICAFVYGMILFQKKDANLNNLGVATGILMVSGAVFSTVFESEIHSLRHGGGATGILASNILEFILGKSGRILVALVAFFYGIVMILKESPKQIDKEFWVEFAKKNKEKIFQWVVPEKDIAQEVKSEIPPKETPLQVEGEMPWFEIKKVPIDWKFATSRNSSNSYYSDTSFKVSYINPVEEETSTPAPEKVEKAENFRARAENFVDFVKKSAPRIKIFEKKIDEPQEDISKPISNSTDEEDLDFTFRETPPSLKEKIYGTQVSKTMEALPVGSGPNWEEELIKSQSMNEDEHVTSAELESLFGGGEDFPIEEETETFESARAEVMDFGNEPMTKDQEIQTALFGGIDEPSQTNEIESVDPDPFPEDKEPRLPLQFTMIPEVNFLRKSTYKIPLKILSGNLEKKANPLFKMEAEYTARKIEEIIKEYGYESRVTTWEKGPIITRYEVAPPPGVKLGKITSLADELKLYLAVKSIRIVAPIPGKSTIGIEVPNKYRENVLLGDIAREASKEADDRDLPIAIGKDSISGQNVIIDLNKLPHLLIAGTTGSGKSVSMNSMISYLILTKSPEEVRFVMIDPKMVEMSLYESIPHLLMPVITDPRKATKALYWAVQEMEARYAMFSNLKCRDLKAYNEKISSNILHRVRYKKMPYLVIFIDELSDLMMVSGKELEDSITRLSQKARAVGIHLVMATQRPSVDVITGLIKANCPARIAFHVAQKTDSKIILDYSGADTLLGKGDFLYKSPTSPDLQRIQAPFISEDEIEKVVQEACSYAKPQYVNINLDEENFREESNEDDEASFEEAWEIVRTERKASASYLQRRMRIGYNKAARLMELMEERGYVGPQIGSKPREILR
jgi:S-DNA-T family DNA segregation ATPase FtsK/SpoIIIE